jgi:uncharacterized membrane protein YciS (DUF1049 family)
MLRPPGLWAFFELVDILHVFNYILSDLVYSVSTSIRGLYGLSDTVFVCWLLCGRTLN